MHALAFALGQTKSAIEPNVALTLALQVMFTMAKMVPAPKSAFDTAPESEGADGSTDGATEGSEESEEPDGSGESG